MYVSIYLSIYLFIYLSIEGEGGRVQYLERPAYT